MIPTNHTTKQTKTIYILLLIVLHSTISIGQSNTNNQITGTIVLDSIWTPKVYLSHIPSFSKMYTMSKSMIIAESNIDKNGYFSFDTNYLPKEDNLYRIHVSKKGASPASLIIGGEDENHFFIIANKNANFQVNNLNNVISAVTIKSSKQNNIIRKVDEIVRYIDSTNFNESRVKSEFITNAFQEQLRKIADTTTYPLASLYALHRSKYETDISKNTKFYHAFLEKWKKEKSPYFQYFREKIPAQKNDFSNYLSLTITILVSFTLGFLFNYIFKRKINTKKKLLQSLSIQERKIFNLLKEGKSNKDISETCNIGISTVKSHVSSIYNKLDIKSRKEVLDIDL
ncbi:helix-turn-helix domain-containing protein [Pontimicrobium sp. MEBiC06410]